MSKLAIIDPKQFGLEETKAKEIASGLQTTIAEREILIEQYNQVLDLEVTKENIQTFKDLRLKIVKNRTQGIMAWHKVNKEFYLRGGQFVDAIKNKEIAVNEAMEEKLEASEKYFENLEKEKIAQLQKQRVLELTPYEVENLAQLDLGNMEQSIFDSFLLGCKTSFEEKKERERKAEEERIAKEKADAEEREAQRIENERLKKEAEEREAQIEAERKANEEKARKEKEESDRILAEEKARQQAELDRIAKQQAEEKAKQDAILEAERKEKQRIEKELQDKKDAELKAIQDAKDAEEKAKKEAEKLAKKSIAIQRQAWINQFSLPQTELNDTKSEEIKAKFNAFIKWANEINNN